MSLPQNMQSRVESDRTGTISAFVRPLLIAHIIYGLKVGGVAAKRSRHGAAGRAAAEARFSLHAMVGAYLEVYDRALGAARLPRDCQ